VNQISALISGLAARRETTSVSPAVLLGTFATALFLSALMLFSVQPLFAKMALPKLGGAPAVWAVSMCFFQTALLAGYCYAHVLNRWLPPTRAVLFHLGLLALTCFALPIGLPASLSEPPAGDAYFWLLAVLALGVGLPFFAVSANAPLLQAWFARTGHADAKDPYFLYGASNLGSLVALLGYPLLIEPLFGLKMQSWVWAGGFAVLATAIAACGLLMLDRSLQPSAAKQQRADEAAVGPAVAISWAARGTWVALAAVPSALMVGVTTYITTDIASTPFLWVLPLALFLLTFILVFKDKLAFPYAWLPYALPPTICLMIFVRDSFEAVLLALSAFFAASLICHRELYLRRPAASSLTEFYIWMSVGGVIGGIAAALVAPQVFSSVIEFKLVLTLSLVFCPGVLLGNGGRIRYQRVLACGALAASGMFLFNSLVDAGYFGPVSVLWWAILEIVLMVMFMTRPVPEHRAIIALTALAIVAMKPTSGTTLHQERSFFGTNRVALSADGRYRMMHHGTTMHGAERVLTDEGQRVVGKPVPLTYFYPGSPMQRGIDLARRSAGGKPLSVAIVGLGTGSLACYARTGENWRYYEIDPMVTRIARDPKLFGFLSACLPDAPVLIGDARLTLKAERDATFNYLLIDAFSSNAIPVHLLTKEAFEGYFDKMAPGGVVAVHISNRYLDLAPSIAATVALMPGVLAAEVMSRPKITGFEAATSQVVYLSKDPAAIAEARAWPDGKALADSGVTAWTDDYSDVLSAILRKAMKPQPAG
jgi:spermidine synthase